MRARVCGRHGRAVGHEGRGAVGEGALAGQGRLRLGSLGNVGGQPVEDEAPGGVVRGGRVRVYHEDDIVAVVVGDGLVGGGVYGERWLLACDYGSASVDRVRDEYHRGHQLTVSSKHLALLDHCCVPVEGEGDAEFGVVAAVHKAELWRRDRQPGACRKG